MSAPSARRNRRQRGRIEELRSGALRVSVYAGTDPLTGRRHYLRETIPAGPRAEDEAQKALRRLANQVDERRNPRTSAPLTSYSTGISNSPSWKRTPSSTTATWPRSTSGH